MVHVFHERRASPVPWIALCLSIVAGAAAILLLMGREPICTCGYVALWHGEPNDSGNSQHLTDWYTPSHVIHGILFYGLTWLAMLGRGHFWQRLALATLIEAAWEILENTPAVIEHYRTATISLDYYGDSVINSVFDILAMWVGFWLASRIPVWASVLVVLALELFVGWMIRDNLALNVLMLLWPLESVKAWQGGG